MKQRIAMLAVVLFSLVVLLSAQVTAQNTGYKLVDIGTFGGPVSYVLPAGQIGSHNQLNGSRTVVGGGGTAIATTATGNPVICGGLESRLSLVNHAFEWQNGNLVDLGSLAGPDSCSVAASVNADGVISGHSETGAVDPVTGFNEVHAVRWKDGAILDLGTFGGAVSFGSGINKSGQIAGFALNGVSDPVSIYDFQIFPGLSNGTETRAFLWTNGFMQDLGTLGGPDAWSTFVNDAGQVAGFSYTDSNINPTTGVPTTHPFLWDPAKGMIDLGTLGGTLAGSEIAFDGGLNNFGQVVGASTLSGDQVFHPFLWTNPGPMQDLGTLGGTNGMAEAINDAGEIIGKADLPETVADPFLGRETFNVSHAFLWKKGTMRDLSTLRGDKSSASSAINNQDQIVGYSCPLTCEDHFHNHAVLWQNGSIFDLNKLIRAGRTGLILTRAFAINDRGEIAGIGTPPSCDFDLICSHTFLLIPCSEFAQGCGDDPQ